METVRVRPPLARQGEGMVAGVCSGVALHLGLPVKRVRWAFALSSVFGGAGIMLYLWLWALVPTQSEYNKQHAYQPASPIAPGVTPAEPEPQSPEAAAASAVTAGKALWNRITSTPNGKEILIGLALLVAAGVALARILGVDVRLELVLPIAAIVGGAVLAWMQLDRDRRDSLSGVSGRGKASWIRLGVGLVLVIAGALLLVTGSISGQQLWLGLVAALAVLAGVALVLLPWGLKLWRDLESERAARVRETQRAEIAAHLHDSVLQTLALIQRRAGSEQDVIRLARAQERELRTWLYTEGPVGEGHLAERVRELAAEVEELHGAVIDVVSVGDLEMNESLEILLQASREALLNAVRHGKGPVSVYVEVSQKQAQIFIKDRGAGFDVENIPTDRLGVRESVIGRMNRSGGTAIINSGPDGTEVRLSASLNAPENTGAREKSTTSAKGKA